MIILDTHVVSEPMRPHGHESVQAWLDEQIAAIAAVHGFTVATRDTAPFVAAGVPVIREA
ncbi:MAG TPA: hypothetical protein VMF03_11790 [Steroidobacteraceae bacterium]|nr:hypothetical protein [Steroidobacteraceae bacterium]